jgi:hypothetical protein
MEPNTSDQASINSTIIVYLRRERHVSCRGYVFSSTNNPIVEGHRIKP